MSFQFPVSSVRSRKERRRSARGFTLIEVLIAVFIGVLLAGIVTVNVLRHLSETRVKTAKIQLRQLKSAVQLYQAEQGRIPTQEQGIEALVRKPTLPPIPPNYPAEGYLEGRRVPRDPWGREYIYGVPGPEGLPFEIITYGSDGEPGGDADAADITTADLGATP